MTDISKKGPEKGKKPPAPEEIKAAPAAGGPPSARQPVRWTIRRRVVKKRLPEQRVHPLFRRVIKITAGFGVAILIILFFALPNLVTYQPAFCGFCHPEVQKQWSTSTHAKTGCLTCHVKSGFQNFLLSRLGLAQRIYLLLDPAEVARMKKKGETPIGFITPPPNETCLTCHQARKRISPGGDIIIPHQSHIKIRKLACTDCHESFVCARVGKGKAVVTMEGCYGCHNGRRATNECTACHTEKGAPLSHRGRWVLEHGADALADKNACMECHSKPKDFCKNCHGNKPASHTADFAVTHASAARIDKAGCLECHDEKVTCVKCHGETGQAHDANWLGQHPIVARNGIRDCFTCHSKYHCNMCHRNPT